MSIKNIIVRPVLKLEEKRYKKLMQKHHYLGFVPKIGETMWYIATIDNEWVSLLGFSASALKCKARDEWIGGVVVNHRNKINRKGEIFSK